MQNCCLKCASTQSALQAHQRDANTSVRLEGALSALMHRAAQANLEGLGTNHVSLSKPVQKAFKEALCSTVQDVRGIIKFR